MPPRYTLSFIFLFVTTLLASSEAQVPYDKPLFISCGLPKSTTATSCTQEWKSDDDDSFAPPNINTISSVTTSIKPNEIPPYDTVRVFQTQLTYSFFLTPGPKFIRLHFTPNTNYNKTPASQYFVSVQGNIVTLFKNYSPQDQMYEFHLTVEKGSEKNLNLSLSPGNIGPNGNSFCKDCYGFISGIEIVPVPNGLYINLTNTAVETAPKYVTNLGAGYTFSNSTALQNLYRLNVGGAFVNPQDDSGKMRRKWVTDNNFLAPGEFQGESGGVQYNTTPDINYTNITPEYVAPKFVYGTSRILGRSSPESHFKLNITWRFEVNQGFDYLIRLHFCELEQNITGSLFRQFQVYINNQVADQLDIFRLSGGLGVPIYRDYIIRVDGGGADAKINNATKVPLWLALYPVEAKVVDVLLNGLEIFRISDFSGNLATPNPPLSTSAIPNEDKKKAMVLGFSISLGTTILLIFCYGLFHVIRRWRQKKRKARFFKRNGGLLLQQQMTTRDNMVDRTKVFTDAELVKATDNYNSNRILGRGGQGTVYKGMLLDGRVVAIKKSLKVDESQIEHFINEVVILSQISHRNVVQLLGCCLETEVPLLVYEFIPNGTLSQHIQNPSEDFPFTWKMRLQIAVDSAGALAYLHSASATPIYHRDVKSSNILLDEKFRAKVADFGTSRTLTIDQTHLTTLVQGTLGYLDPEYFQTNQFTEKSDVYSFGVVLIELLTGQKPLTSEQSGGWKCLIVEFLLHMETSRLFDIIDPRILDEAKQEELFILASLAMRCLNLNGKHRPTMKEVVSALEGIRSSSLPEVAEHIYSTKETKENMEKVKTNGIVGDRVASSMVYHSKNDIGPSSSDEVKPLMHYTI